MTFDAFALNREILSRYEDFARSFTQIRAADIRERVDQIYAGQTFWPEPLIQLNPHYRDSGSLSDLCGAGPDALHPGCADIFAFDGKPISLRRHQADAVAIALEHRSFVVTTGTGSGKSLCFFIPIVDAVLKAKDAGEKPSTKAIVVYPMNALANSQLEELKKFLGDKGVTYKRLTGDVGEAERNEIAANPPDILLTNFMMLELLMTRQAELDRTIIKNCTGLKFIVLDELHTYRGRQGADVALLMRRLKARTFAGREPICVGTSATMSSGPAEAERNAAVASVASKIFGAAIDSSSVVTETLQPVTHVRRLLDGKAFALTEAVRASAAESVYLGKPNRALIDDPLAIWIEARLGLQKLETEKPERARPISTSDAAAHLAEDASLPVETCRSALENALRAFSLSEKDRGVQGGSDEPLFAFKLHQFISGAGRLYATLEAAGKREVTVNGQVFSPRDGGSRLYPVHFCRNCGQEHHPVALRANDAEPAIFLSREIDDLPAREETKATPTWGFLMPEPAENFAFSGRAEDFPEAWQQETRSGEVVLKPTYRRTQPERVLVNSDGTTGMAGSPAWFLPGKFKFCPACGDYHTDSTRDINRLASLSAEGRSSATTVLVASMLSWMNEGDHVVRENARKLLAFTDNRQDAALQAGHFNDFIFVTLLRSAILAALRDAGSDGLAQEDLGKAIVSALGFEAQNRERRAEWLFEPTIKGAAVLDAERYMREGLSYRFWGDQRRGWRFTNPNLEQLGLIKPVYRALEELATDDEEFENNSSLRRMTPEQRSEVLTHLLDHMRRGLAVECDALDEQRTEALSGKMRKVIKPPWALDDERERLTRASVLVLAGPRRREVKARDETLLLRAGPQSLLGRTLKRLSFFESRISKDDYEALIQCLLKACTNYGLVAPCPSPLGSEGWRMLGSAVIFSQREPHETAKIENAFFMRLYSAIAEELRAGGKALFGYEAREHTAQVDGARREFREARFRYGPDDQDMLEDRAGELREMREDRSFLPALVCSPTMELGVDISSMNVVYMRNVPPTPANYAQRSGRGGRSGQAALVVSYCAAQSPHDQYYFRNRSQMVSGIVRPPSIDLKNRDLVESHVWAEWLSASGIDLRPSIADSLDMQSENRSLLPDLMEAAKSERVRQAALERAEHLLCLLEADFGDAPPEWFEGARSFAEEAIAAAPDTFDQAFERWRNLLKSAKQQMAEADRVINDHQSSPRDRKSARSQWGRAYLQQELLLGGSEKLGSDFYTYRYLATEGFLPGYNFPRLPLMAFVPGVGDQSHQRFIQRPRFLAISEFGPKSVIYHEGRAYRVDRAMLKEAASAEHGKLETDSLWACGSCGAFHDREAPEECHACGASLNANAELLRDLYRIENVATYPIERITANDEERQRQGFEVVTTFAFDGSSDRVRVDFVDDGTVLLSGSYASSARIRRINKGLKRRANPSAIGFWIDPKTGRWREAPGEPDDENPDREPQRIAPVVEDRKNALLLRFADLGLLSDADRDGRAVATVQHALLRGIGTVFQLDEGEVIAEPVPAAKERSGLLLYEASEGGAGALGRLVREPEKLAEIARCALEIMHFDPASIDTNRGAAELSDLASERCAAGCYECLLSYFNQPDHELIDRKNQVALAFLLRLAAAKAVSADSGVAVGGQVSAGWPDPDREALALDGKALALVWRRARLCAVEADDYSDHLQSAADAKGFDLVVLPSEPKAREGAIEQIRFRLAEMTAS
ncbi:RNA helicase [Marinicauda pacifica]|uniref:DEAD/DEAH box helicase n=1 Tax=Marinicauda pacifica TaxID=1133559 RepID=A0A4S2HB41_9PROT|nr:DEAD/DEAH box helicase [Marinicauda pacifica]TGY93134.1 DEAD/DEAH box helicase [Marinicauda pacifica]GGE43148.1 RNA helicase [Marinicauda pacifica]